MGWFKLIDKKHNVEIFENPQATSESSRTSANTCYFYLVTWKESGRKFSVGFDILDMATVFAYDISEKLRVEDKINSLGFVSNYITDTKESDKKFRKKRVEGYKIPDFDKYIFSPLYQMISIARMQNVSEIKVPCYHKHILSKEFTTRVYLPSVPYLFDKGFAKYLLPETEWGNMMEDWGRKEELIFKEMEELLKTPIKP